MINTELPSVNIVILNWNGWKDTIECLQSVQQINYRNFCVLVVDNGSSDKSVEQIQQAFPDVDILQTGANLGYAGGNNVGIRWALEHGADYILLLNNDTVVATDILSAFINAEKLLPAGSILGAKIFFYNEPGKLWFAGGQWNSRSNSFEHIGHGQSDSAEYNRMAEVDYITGCALFVGADTFKEVGLLDERFFLSYEETDWCYRARASGHKCIVVPDAKLWHKISSSFGGADTPLFNYFMVRNKLLWAKNHLSRSARISLHKDNIRTLRRIVLPPFILAKTGFPIEKNLLWSFTTWLKTVRMSLANPMNQAKLMALRDYYLGRFGNCPPKIRTFRKQQKKS